MDHRFISYIEALKQTAKNDEKGLSIVPINFESFQATIKNKGILTLAQLADLHSWTRDVLRVSLSQIEFIFSYHPSSPKFWLKGIDEPVCSLEEEEIPRYSVGIDLEDFMESNYRSKQKARIESVGTFIPDNYELAKTVLKRFNNETSNKRKISDTSFRELANWESGDVTVIKDLGDFIQKTYVRPSLKKILKSANAKDVKFLNETSFDFIYNKPIKNL